MMRGFNFYYGFHLIPIIYGLLFLGGIIALVVYVVNKLSNVYTINKKMTNNEALQILNKRFAAGEIDEEEYKRKKKILLDE
ncbi:SHOCT domain-containing protein [Caldicellulosiruptoraceae bacterium PP1]